MTSSLGFGITARPRDGHAELARRLVELGYDALWANDTPAGSALAVLAEAAVGGPSLSLASGVIALSHRPPASIAAEVDRLALPRDRLVVGVGSGSSRSLALVRDSTAELRRLVPGVAIGVGALGPRMCRLAGEIADVVLLNWVLPERIRTSRQWVAEGASAAGRPSPRVAAYIRVAIGLDAAERLRKEQDRYLRDAAQYRAAGGDQTGLVGIASEDGAGIAEALAPYRDVLDEAIVRGLPAGDGVEEWIAIAEAAVR